MRPDVIQDEHSDHEDQTVHERYLSDTCGGEYKGQARYRHVKRKYSQTRTAAAARERRSGSLSMPRRRQLLRVGVTIYEHTALMTDALHRAANSEFIDPEFMKKLAVVMDNLEAVAVAIKIYIDQNKERGTGQLKERATLQVSEARSWFTYLDKILAMLLGRMPKHTYANAF